MCRGEALSEIPRSRSGMFRVYKGVAKCGVLAVAVSLRRGDVAACEHQMKLMCFW